MQNRHALIETFDQIVSQQLPNLYRLYLNPFVAQTCFCLERYIHNTWPTTETFQTFLANGFDEALSGAIKLARYDASIASRPSSGLVIDSADRLGPFATAPAAGGAIVTFVPGLTVARTQDEIAAALSGGQSFGFVVLQATANKALTPNAQEIPLLALRAREIRQLVQKTSALVITCVSRSSLAGAAGSDVVKELRPDIVIFDESFVDHDVPFAAFTARKSLYDHWNHSAKSTFHSTTYQPNTISSLHFMRCLEQADPKMHKSVAAELAQIESDMNLRKTLFGRLYSPTLAKAITTTGFDTPDVRAAGHFVYADRRAVLDGVSGVACSIRGHNPSTYVAEMAALADTDAEPLVAARLRELTGLERMLPAVSGATAVENALKIALVAQFPRRHVLALKSGFGGKTLFALTGTWNATYKEHIDPLYGDVLYVDPFAADALARIDAVLAEHDVAVVQAELVQGVGGVRRVPEQVIRHLQSRRDEKGYLLLIDEVQTGMYRTGPFSLARAMGLTPDLLVAGKAASDMMFPFALLLYTDKVQEKLARAGSQLPAAIRERYGYAFGYRTVLNVLRIADEIRLPERVAEAGALFARLLGEGLASCKAVREVRVHGLLIGIELDPSRWPQRWFRKKLFWFYLFAMLRHAGYPVLVGFCQYEPNVLKITPPLTVDAAEIRQMCGTIAEVLRRPFWRLLAGAVGALVKSRLWRRKHDHRHIDNEQLVPAADAPAHR